MKKKGLLALSKKSKFRTTELLENGTLRWKWSKQIMKLPFYLMYCFFKFCSHIFSFLSFSNGRSQQFGTKYDIWNQSSCCKWKRARRVQ